MTIRLATLIIGICIGACSSRSNHQLISYVEIACDSLKFYSIHHDLNFDSIEQDIIHQLSDTSTIGHVHLLLNSAAKSIDPHSFLLSYSDQKNLETGNAEIVPEPFPFRGKLLKQRYAYLDILGFSGVDSVSADRYTDSLQRVLVSLYQDNPKGWVIDLRSNTGGNPYAMIAGLGPLLSDGDLAYCVDSHGKKESYFYMRKKTKSAEMEFIQLADSAYLFEKKMSIAVLTGPKTASAAEILTIIFKGIPNALVIGQPTYGVSTGLHHVYLPDSACLYITNSVDHDILGRAYGKAVEPDVLENDALKVFEHAYRYIDTALVHFK